MKNKGILIGLSLSLATVGLAAAILGGVQSKAVEGYSTSSLPTEIDLNDTSAANIRSYYSSLNGLSTSERQGNNLLKNLKTILKKDQHYFSYDGGNAIWQIYEIADRDWDKSPASSTTYGTYNSTTKKITNYVYGTSASSSKNNPYIHALYINRDVENLTTAWDDHQQTEWGINREHVWPKAEGFETSGAGGARGDPMHLMAGNGYSNNIHSNYYYGYVKTTSSYTDCGTKYSNQSGNLRGTSKTLNTGTVFEPQDCDKGDIARAIFYMVARYNYLSGSDSDGIDSNNPNLVLTQNYSDWSNTGYSSTTSNPGKMGIMTDLLNWHHQDPVDAYEIHRNNLLYTNYTNNRNPFIDFPEWVDFIWGTATYSGTTYQSYSSTPTGYATPSSDTINGYNSGGTTVSVTGVTLNTDATSIEVGSTEQLTATVEPANATNKTVTWSTSDSSVATVSNGLVRGISEGTATITVRTNDGNKTDSCSVSVTASSGTETSKVSILQDDSFNPALPTASGDVHTTSTYHLDERSGIGFKEQGIYKGSSSNYIMFASGKGFIYNTTSLGTIDKVSVTYSGGTSTDGKIGVYFGNSEQSTYTTSGNDTIKGRSETDVFENTTDGYGFFQLSTSNKNVQITKIEIDYHTEDVAELTSITLDTSEVQKVFEVDEEFNYDDLSVTAHYDDGSEDIVVPTSVSSPDMSTAGEKEITVSYTEGGVTKEATYTITINTPVATEIYASVKNNKTFKVGDVITKSDIVVTNDLDETVTDFEFSSYQFTYEDATSGGTLTDKEFEITSGNLSTTLVAKVQRAAHEQSTISDTLDKAFTGLEDSETYYVEWKDKVANSNAIYSGFSGGSYGAIQMKSDPTNNNYYTNKYSGIVTNRSGGIISKVTVSWNTKTTNGRTLNIYGKNTPYSTPNDLYNEDDRGILLGTIIKGTSTELTVSGVYAYIGVTSAQYAMYIDEITFEYATDTPTSLANYIMYEDTPNQCSSKFSAAKTYFIAMTDSQRNTFMSSEDYVIATARERFEAWAANRGEHIDYVNGDYVFNAPSMSGYNFLATNDSSISTLIIILVLGVGVTASSIYLIKRRKSE